MAGFAPRQAEAVQLSYFGGLTFAEIALALEVSEVTVKRGGLSRRQPGWMCGQASRPTSQSKTFLRPRTLPGSSLPINASTFCTSAGEPYPK
ncbi:MAG TPA: sigma factor-like helix-turn-helix DNA-binding protein [Thermoanaerobaculia bacterium]|nr:sigma factor-like helix-turn-helix DNA-binding protein [Thermoanaerobaculia bacterium]